LLSHGLREVRRPLCVCVQLVAQSAAEWTMSSVPAVARTTDSAEVGFEFYLFLWRKQKQLQQRQHMFLYLTNKMKVNRE